MNNEFLNLIERLVNNEVDFVIVGGMAGIVHGCTYATQDIDICCDFSSPNLLALQKAISDLEPVHRMTPGRKKLELSEEACTQFNNLYLDTIQGQLGCLCFISGLGDYSRVKQESEVFDIEGVKIRVLNLDALIRAKKAMNRPRDKEVVSQLDAIREIRKQQDSCSKD